MAKKVTVKNFEKVLDSIKNMFKEANKVEKNLWCESLNNMLDEQHQMDFFGTEGQLDPRNNNQNK
jgi:hypothetical protein